MFESKANLLLSELDVLFGITRSCTHRLAPNHLILLGKYFLYVKVLNNIKLVFNGFISLCNEIIEIEKYNAFISNDEKKFKKKWKYLITSKGEYFSN